MKQGEWATQKHEHDQLVDDQLTWLTGKGPLERAVEEKSPTSGTVHDFTGIPANVKQIIIDFDDGCGASR